MYQSYGGASAGLVKEFKKTFAIDVRVQFVGVWDTVSSIDLIPRTLPFSTSNDGVVTFRHALALDERRARFRPSLWGEPLGRREILDDDPKINYRSPNTPRDEWNFEPLPITNVKEVWFAGHWDNPSPYVQPADLAISLANIPLRWMIKECISTETGIEFDQDTLLTLGFRREVTLPGYQWEKLERVWAKTQSLTSNEILSSFKSLDVQPWVKEDLTVDSIAEIFDQLKPKKSWWGVLWWLIEVIPTMILLQTQLAGYSLESATEDVVATSSQVMALSLFMHLCSNGWN
ncbi:hypothetical protein BDN72DRAFT_901547 [Pluteus cervinus]|uniref:Uncharacterized protein n=1 Tax=Pluteus cervinus TaxID=181527 RepID=A0ACD3AFY7_9AGAR|nr:hypothetical protein BDN72DRAFT_901547 [Pluteus cervinus]